MKYISSSKNDLQAIAKNILKTFNHKRVFVFVGNMGAGKTTFIQHLCLELGVNESVTSPTFSLVNEYRNNQNATIYHFDMYRIEKEEEALNIGFEEYLNSKNYCFIEWPDRVSGLLPKEYVLIKISVEEKQRKISVDIEN